MNKDQAKGVAKNAAGSVQRRTGKLIGSERQEAKGLGKQVAGKAQKAFGDALEALKPARTTRSNKQRG